MPPKACPVRKRPRSYTARWVSVLLIAGVANLTMATSVCAGSPFNARRTFGSLFVGSSLFLAKRAVDFRRDANEIYDRYLKASTAEEARELFRRSSDRDTKSQLAAGLSVVLLAGGLRLLLTSRSDDNIPRMRRGLTLGEDLAVDLGGDLYRRHVGFALKRRF